MKNIFERLFNGEISPSEKAVPTTGAYRQALQELQAANTALNAVLDERQQELLKEMLDCRESVFYHEYVCVFEEGIRFGVELMSEVYHMGRDAPLLQPQEHNEVKDNG